MEPIRRSDGPSARLERMLGFVARDPQNAALLEQAAASALDERHPEIAAGLIDRYRTASPLPPALTNLRGLVAIALGDHADAIALLAPLHAIDPADAAIRFNLAWASAMIGDHEAVVDLLDDDALLASRRAPVLKVQALHHLARFDEALACGEALAARFPDNTLLMGALATMALDAGVPEAAGHYAERAGDDPDGLTARGLMSLNDGDAEGARACFADAIAAAPRNGRAWVGRGLETLSSGDPGAAADALDRGAALFEDHLGSWIAAGWAHALNGDMATARARFEHARGLDPNFSESHGGIAYLDLVQGDEAEAKRHSDIALRLDRESLGGTLVRTLLLERQGKSGAAAALRAAAMNKTLGPDGKTLAAALATLVARRGS